MAGLLDKLKIKRTPQVKAPKAAEPGKAPFWARKKKGTEPPAANDAANAPAKTAKSLSWRKVTKEKPAIVPKLPDTSGPVPIVYDLDTDSLLSGGRRKMAIGLLWQPRAIGQALHAQAKSASVGETVFDLSVLNADGAQVGFAATIDAHKNGMMAAATAIPRAFMGDTWLAAFVLPVDGDKLQLAWWIVAHRDGLVYEDRLVRNEIEARESFIDLYDAPGWQTVVCPSNWQMGDSRDVGLGYLIKPGTKGAVLKPHNLVKIWAPRAIAAALVLGGVIGGYSYWQNIQEQKRIAEQQRLQDEEMARLDALQLPPWQDMPDLQASVIACATLINELQVNPPGWILDPVTCTVSPGTVSASATWKRQVGTKATYLYSALDLRGLPAPQLDPTLQSGSVSRSAGIQPKEWGEGLEPLDPNVMFLRLVHRFDTLALPLTLTAQVAPVTPNESGAPNRKIWNYHSIELESSAFPTELIELIGDIPAVVPQSLTYTPGTQVWKLTAFIYHPPIIQTTS
jgi:hypothetical protein